MSLMMRNSMIIKHDSGNSEHFICPCVNCKTGSDEIIPTFYSYGHAIDAGWLATQDRRYCPPREGQVFVCPECCKEELWNKLTTT